MARECKVCTSPDREAIERQIISGMSNRKIASLCDGIREASIRRHRASHLAEKLAKAEEAQQTTEADTLLAEVRELLDKARSLLESAEAGGDLRTALVGIKEARGYLELLAKLKGQLDERPQVHLHLSSEWVELRALIVLALEPHPEARRDVLRALEGGGNGSTRS